MPEAHPGVWVVRTDLDHLLIRHPLHGWPRPGGKFRTPQGQHGRCVERFCEIAVLWLGWGDLPRNTPVRATLA